MPFSVDVVSLVLYFVQQLGVMLGVGAQTVILVSYLFANRDGVVDQKEELFGKAVLRVLKVGLGLIVLSGILVTLLHFSLGQFAVVETPAYLFKWGLIVFIGTLTFVFGSRVYMHFIWEGMLGAHWYALFIIHVLAPLAAWLDILVLYVLWSVGFMLVWSAIVHAVRAKTTTPTKPAEKRPSGSLVQPMTAGEARPFSPRGLPTPKPTPPPAPKPIVPAPHKPEELPAPPLPSVALAKEGLPAVALAVPHKPAPLPVPPPPPKPVVLVPQKQKLAVPQKPIEDPDAHPGLPTIRVMPQTPQDVDRQMRASIVQFDQQ